MEIIKQLDMEFVILTMTTILFVSSLFIAAWLLIDTRKRYYREYKQRK